jgi:PPOX class probable F420-dependent enzyme
MPTTLDPSTKDGARALDQLATDKIGWLTTVTPDGQPQSTPIWFLWTDGEVIVYSFKTAKRNANLETNPRVAFNLHTDPGGGDVVSMEGTARFDPDGVRSSQNPAFQAKYGDWLKEYDWTPEYFEGEYPVTTRITPVRWRLK